MKELMGNGEEEKVIDLQKLGKPYSKVIKLSFCEDDLTSQKQAEVSPKAAGFVNLLSVLHEILKESQQAKELVLWFSFWRANF